MKHEKFIASTLMTLSIFSFGLGGGGEIANTIKLESNAFKNGGIIPTVYTCDGADISPDLKWENFPENTKSFILIVEDPDAPIGIFTHWVVYDIPSTVNELPKNFPKVPEIDGIKQGRNDFGRIGYGGPCPPPGPPHRYIFKIYALDTPSINLPAGATKSQVQSAMSKHVLAKGELLGIYGR